MYQHKPSTLCALLDNKTSHTDTIALAVIFMVLQPFSDILQLPTYSAQWFQYCTAHWVHIGWLHWLLNTVTLLFLPVLLPSVPRKFFWSLVLCLPITISYILVTQEQLSSISVTSYVGFSGVLHGIYIFFGLYICFCAVVTRLNINTPASIKNNIPRYFIWQSFLLVILVVIKVCYELLYQPSQTAELLTATIVYSAHFDGVMLGLGAFLAYLVWFFACILYAHSHPSP